MSPWWIVAAGAGGVWWILRGKKRETLVLDDGGATITPSSFNISSVAPAAKKAADGRGSAVSSSPSANSSVWLDHVKEASTMVDDMKTAQDRGLDTTPIIDAMGAPLDVLTAQRDLNLLGATPAIVEDGQMGPKTKQALKDFQTHTGVTASGLLDASTSQMIRYAVGSHVNTSPDTNA